MADDSATQANTALSASDKEGDALMDIDDHEALITTAKAIKTEAGEHGMSDDDIPKVLTTLETVKKASVEPPAEEEEEEEIELCPYEEDDEAIEESAILLEVYNDEIDMPLKDAESTVNGGSSGYRFSNALKIGSEISIKRVNEKPQKSDDLIAILEGIDDNTEHYKVDMPAVPKKLSDEEAREIALEQMMNLPKKKKGRPRLNPEDKAKKATKRSKNGDTLVKDLMGDWDDPDAHKEDGTETEFLVEFGNNGNGVAEINKISTISKKPPAEATFKRTRVVKKRVIWDPDAPETAVNYASYAHTSGPGAQKRANARMKPAGSSETISDADSTSPMSKRKKLSEIDKLLGDEGAANMLNSLNQANNGSAYAKPSRSKAVKSEPAEAVELKSTTPQKDTKDNSVQKRNPTPTKVGKKRGPKKASSTWDYVYSSQPDDCMIIRRRSNSSYSSTTSLNRSSIDLPSAPPVFDDKDPEFQFTKPNVPTKQENDGEAPAGAKNVRGRKRKAKSNGVEFNEITVTKRKQFSQISINKRVGALGKFSLGLMREIKSALQALDNDDSCNLVLITTEDNTFCNEIDISPLRAATNEKRKDIAQELCKVIR